MATVTHCLYCFESLEAFLEKRPSLSLAEVEKSWVEFADEQSPPSSSWSGKLSKQLPALRRLAGGAGSSGPGSGSASGSGSSGLSTPSSVSTTSLGPDTPATSTSTLSYAAAATSTSITESPLFVTWNTVSSRDGSHRSLRGCIGTFEDQELDDGLRSYAVTAAVHDTRFDPVAAAELPSLEVAVTLLTDFEPCEDAMDWELGTHGLRISFVHHGRKFGATYLPDVAPEQGWTKEETLVSLMRKAGWMGRRDRWRDVDLKVVRYQGKKEDVEYGVFRAWRDWHKAKKAAG